jgi:biotin carboxyl carrier protein
VQYDVSIGERVRRVVVQRAGEGWRVTLDGAAHDVHAARVSPGGLSLLFTTPGREGHTRSVRAAVVPGRASGDLDVYINGHHVPVGLREGGGPRRESGAADTRGGPQRLLAPMPGRVLRVLVAPGDVVTARQGLLVVEAMKMENELRATRDGRVVAVSVVEGQSVDAGAVLAVVE